MDRYIIQQEASGWFWRREGARGPGGWFGWLWYDPPMSGGPFATAAEAEQDARKDQFRRFSAGSGGVAG
jgi:hypothetical protein